MCTQEAARHVLHGRSGAASRRRDSALLRVPLPAAAIGALAAPVAAIAAPVAAIAAPVAALPLHAAAGRHLQACSRRCARIASRRARKCRNYAPSRAVNSKLPD
jgi:hypothetical protein